MKSEFVKTTNEVKKDVQTASMHLWEYLGQKAFALHMSLLFFPFYPL